VEGLTQLVNESLHRNGYKITLDHRRVQWSAWSECDGVFSALLLPMCPGLLVLGEEIVPMTASSGRRMLALWRILEADDLGIAMARLFAPGSNDREKLGSGRFFFRYAPMEDPVQRRTALKALERWLENASEQASGFLD